MPPKGKPTCGKGHPMEGDNLLFNGKGHRYCRECRNKICREYMRRTAAARTARRRELRAAMPAKPPKLPKVRTTRPARPPAFVRMMANVTTGDGCWEWGGRQTVRGYGRLMGDDRKPVLAHRLSYMAAHSIGSLPADAFVCHVCDNPRCVRPTHLFLGSAADNNRDMAQKGRHGAAKRTHCPQGHAYSEENTWRHAGRRHCRECMRIRSREAGEARARVAAETGISHTELRGRGVMQKLQRPTR